MRIRKQVSEPALLSALSNIFRLFLSLSFTGARASHNAPSVACLVFHGSSSSKHNDILDTGAMDWEWTEMGFLLSYLDRVAPSRVITEPYIYYVDVLLLCCAVICSLSSTV